MATLSRFEIVGLPHFISNEKAYQRKLNLIDMMGSDNPSDYKLGVSYVSPLESFVARELVSLVTVISKEYDDQEYCTLAVNRVISKFKNQSKLKRFIFTAYLEFYVDSQLPDEDILDEANHGRITLRFVNESVNVEMMYKTLVLTRQIPIVSKEGYVLDTKKELKIYRNDILITPTDSDVSNYTLLKYLPVNFNVINIIDYVDHTKSNKTKYNILQFAFKNLDKIFNILTEHEDFEISSIKNSVLFKGNLVNNFALNTVEKCTVNDKEFFTGTVSDVSTSKFKAPLFYKNLLNEFDKEFTLMFFIATCLLYFKKNEVVFLMYSFRNSDVKIYDTSRIYSMLMSNEFDGKTDDDILTDDSPTVSIIIS